MTVALLLGLMLLACPTPSAQAQTGADKQDSSQADDPSPDEVRNPFPDRVKPPAGILDGGAEWLNTSGDITLRDLRGKIVVIDFWTYCCINCIHVLPDLKYLEKKYPNELVVIGVHSAKFDNEKDSENIRQAIMRYEIDHPVVNDNQMAIWRKFGTRAWPTLAIIDPEGYYLGSQSGEGHRELFDAIIGRLIKYHRAKGTLDETPIRFDLERNRVKPNALRYPGKVCVDESGQRIFVADTGHNRIIVTNFEGKLLATVGSGAIGHKDGSYAEACFDHPQGLAVAGETLYVADTENHCLRAVDLSAKTVTTLAGTGEQDRQRKSAGKLRETALNSPWALQVLDGTLFIAMAGPHQLWQHRIGSDEISVFAGSGREDVINGPLREAALAQPSGIATDGSFLYVVDSEGSSVRKSDTSDGGSIITVAGTSELPRGQSLFAFGDQDGVGAEVRLQHPLGIAYRDGELFVADSYNHKIKRIALKDGRTTTWLGDGSPGVDLKPPRFSEPGGLAIAGDKLLVADTNNHRICLVEIETGATTVLKIEGLTPPSPTASAGDDVPSAESAMTLAEQTVNAKGELAIEIQLTLPAEHKLNKEMPVTWQLLAGTSPAVVPADALGKPNRITAAENALKFSVPLVDAPTSGVVKIAVRYGYCRDGTGGVCRIANGSWSIPVKIDTKAEAGSITIQAKPQQK